MNSELSNAFEGQFACIRLLIGWVEVLTYGMDGSRRGHDYSFRIRTRR